MTKAVYAGSFDPITKGHFDIVDQALKVFDSIIIAIGDNPKKTRTFSVQETEKLIKNSIRQRNASWIHRIEVKSFSGTLMRFAETSNADVIVRGLRQVSDFNDEFVQHAVNTRLSNIPIIYFICHDEFLHVSSSTAKEIASYNEDVSWLVDPNIEEALKKYYA